MVFENLLFLTDLENFAIFLPLITVTNLSTVVISSKKSLRGDSRIIHRPRLRRPCSTAFEHSSDPICPLTSDVTSTRTGIASTIIRTRGKLTVYMCVYIYACMYKSDLGQDFHLDKKCRPTSQPSYGELDRSSA